MAIQGPLTITIAAGVALIAASQGFGGIAHRRAIVARWVFIAAVAFMVARLAL